MNRQESDILVIGGGPAGLSAALSAAEASDATVTLVDDNLVLGGQIWRADLLATKNPKPRRLIGAVRSGRIEVLNQTQVFASPAVGTLLATTPADPLRLTFKDLIIATGSRERFIPFPGWTLPGVFGAGGLQALVKGGLDVSGKRIVVAGTGPLLLAVAEFLKEKGADVLGIAEQAPAARIRRFAAGLLLSPAKLSQAISLKWRLRGTPYWPDCWITSAAGSERLETVNLIRDGRTITIDCDFFDCGFHLVPNTELAALLGCRITNGFVETDEYQQTSVEHVYCAGEPTGIGGVEASLLEGKIAGLAAAGRRDAAGPLLPKRRRLNQFIAAMNDTFELREELKHLADDSTIVCRCEDVQFGALKNFSSFREAKLQTRCGMGPCQGRICGPATEFLFGWRSDSVRPPIFPVKMEYL